jgi:hypothetical protein
MSFGRSFRLVFLLACVAAPAQAGALKLEPWRGHVSFGYAHLFSDSYSPGGSFSVAGGVDYPLGSRLRLGPVLGIALLGSHEVTRGSVTAGLDYSLLEGALQLHWLPASGYITRVSLGPGLAAARSALQVGAGGAEFLDLAVDEVKPELALDVTAVPRRMQVVAVGIEAGLRIVPVDRVTWTLATARFTIHY